jgi:hypothetical protein
LVSESDLVPILLCEQDATSAACPGTLAILSVDVLSHDIQDLTASAMHKVRAGGSETNAKSAVHQCALRRAVETLRTKFAQHIYLTGN